MTLRVQEKPLFHVFLEETGFKTRVVLDNTTWRFEKNVVENVLLILILLVHVNED